MLEHLIADLFAFSRLEYLEQSPHKEPMDFSKLVSKAIDDVHLQAEAKNVVLSIDDASVEIQGDWLLLARALNNLLDNALRHTPADGNIRIAWHKSDSKLQFTVADSGPGIDPHDLPHLFKPLYRADSSRNRETGGAGLGLAIARRILQAHGGDLSAANRVGGGAEFTGWLPG